MAEARKRLAKQMKAAGLQKLRWYCEMCSKQCRDANGFKCHTMSEGHQRMMLVFSERPGQFLDNFSKEFDKVYQDILKRRYRNKRVFANKIYQEVISDRNHVHLNATKWHTLGSYIRSLAKRNICEVDETEKGLYIKYIDRDPTVLKRQEELKKKEKMKKDDEYRNQKLIERQMQAAREIENREAEENEPTALKRDENDSAITFNIKSTTVQQKKPILKPKLSSFALDDEQEDGAPKDNNLSTRKRKLQPPFQKQKDSKQRKLSALDALKGENEYRREILARKDYWLCKGIVVKIMNRKLKDGMFYKLKGVVEKVIDRYVGLVKVEVDGKRMKLKLDQNDLETVIPKLGSNVRIVNGAHRGEVGVLRKVNYDDYNTKIELTKGAYHGKVLIKAYEDICKIQQAS